MNYGSLWHSSDNISLKHTFSNKFNSHTASLSVLKRVVLRPAFKEGYNLSYKPLYESLLHRRRKISAIECHSRGSSMALPLSIMMTNGHLDTDIGHITLHNSYIHSSTVSLHTFISRGQYYIAPINGFLLRARLNNSFNHYMGFLAPQ